jgi:4-amino-4-deoxy-L-arabinose transferase-like glycosyltransferase
VLWGGWLLVTGLVFSIAQGIWHEYYTTMLAPAVAAVTAAGLTLLWREHRHTLLPVAIALGGTWAYVVSSRTPEWQGWTRWVVLALTVLSVLALLVHRWPRPAVALGLGALLITPAVWSALVAITHDASGGLPAAGPRAVALSRIALATRSGRPGELSDTQREVLSYAETHGGGADITLAVDGGALFAADFVINADSTVIGLGGFAGSDAAPSLDTLRGWISDGTLRFVLEPAVRPSEELVGAAQWQRSTWIAQHCAPVDPRAYGSGAARDTLYDCR